MLPLMASMVPKTLRSMAGASAGVAMAAYCEGSIEWPPKQNIALATAAMVPAVPVEKEVVLSGDVGAAAALAPPM